ncbi:dinucleotide-utilizing enzyme [Microbacterium candidum]|uniref:Dinucleotide-utilizing enzyme n=1 Tax=Microbacterium candidum TaxID=3041922 RepID=A0ABT7MZN9_9MICO|nr:dinucleotide-utilizing enzyme [Microbacterium sp. ASV49]MDL9979897.1 dinucleotide-utilizing enzyme [Microbacterium sp. ASV49]
MLTRPSLARSIPFWVLFIGSLASTAFGVVFVSTNITAMTTAIKSGAQTAVIDVYSSQSWIVLGAAFVGAGLVGLVAALFLGVLTRFAPAAQVEAVEPAPAAVAPVAASPFTEAAPAAETVPEAPAAEPTADGDAPAAEKTEG